MCNREVITINEVLDDEVTRAHLPEQYSKARILQQINDPTLMGLNLDEVCEMNMEALASTVLLAQDWVMNEQAELMAMMEFEQAQRDQQQAEQELAEPEEGEELVRITVDAMGVEAYVLLKQPEEGKAPPTRQNICMALRRQGVVRGIKEDYVTRLAQHPVYERKFKIAQGLAPVPGEDGYIIYHFERVVDMAPPVDEMGIADYKTHNYIQNVKQGDLLCDIVQATVGSSGYSVRDELLIGTMGKPTNLLRGTNTMLSEDRKYLYAACDGQALRRGNTVYVSRVLTLDKVDITTGNILFAGTVRVLGDISSGFSIRAGGNIIIDGVAENAVLVAGNNIDICGGVKGQGSDIMVAGGSIRALFIENARVEAKGNVYADVILNSQVKSDTSIQVFGKNGKIIGGVCTAGETIRTLQAGNDVNRATNLIIKDPDAFGKAKAQNMLTIAKYREAVVNLEAAAEFAAASKLSTPATEVMLCRAVVTKLRLERTVRELERKNAETGRQRLHRCRMEAQEALYPNVTLAIDGVVYKNLTQRPSCVITKAGNKLAFRSY